MTLSILTANHRLAWRTSFAATGGPAPPIQLRGLPPGASRLGSKRALLAGLGGTGGPLAESCVRVGLSLTCIDPDDFGPESWRTQSCTHADAGRAKADVLLERLHAINPQVSLRAGRGWVQDLPWQLLQQSDVLLSAGDNLAMVVALGRLAQAFGRPLVQAAVHGESLSAIVRRWDFRDAAAACPGCALGAADWNALAIRQGCDLKSLPAGGAIPTQTVPYVCAAAGQLAAAEAIRVLLNAPAEASASETLLTLESFHTVTTTLERQQNCRCAHAAWDVESLRDGPEQTTLSDVLARAPFRPAADLDVSAELPWCVYTACGSCGRWCPVGRFARAGDLVGACQCGAELHAVPHGLRRVIPRADIEQRAGQPLAEVGLPSGRAIVVEDGASPPWCGFVGPLRDVPGLMDGNPAEGPRAWAMLQSPFPMRVPD